MSHNLDTHDNENASSLWEQYVLYILHNPVHTIYIESDHDINA